MKVATLSKWLTLANVVDCIGTLLAWSIGHYEANPLLWRLLDAHPILFIAAKLAMVDALGAVLVSAAHINERAARRALWALAVVLSIAAASNFAAYSIFYGRV